MLLEQNGAFNRLTPKFRKELETRVKGFGKIVRYSFDISRANPDPEKKDGPVVWPGTYTLDPITFSVIDPYEERQGEQRLKRIGLVEQVNEKGEPSKFTRIRIQSGHKGLAIFDTDNPEDFAKVMFLELHPKTADGVNQDKGTMPKVRRIDEKKLSKEKSEERSERLKAMNAAAQMSEAEIVEFADAMGWDSTQDQSIIKSMLEDMAENESKFFNEQVENKKDIACRAIVKRALDKQVIGFDPVEWKFVWAKNNQTIAQLQQVDGKGHIEQMATFIQKGGKEAEALFDKIKSYLK